VLELAVARALYDRYPEFSEGRMTEIRAHVVSRASCAEVARELGLGRRLVERGAAADIPAEELDRITRSRNVLAAVLEAALAALLLEHGFESIESAVVDAFAGRIEYARSGHVDHKTELQEVLARDSRQVHYVVLAADGPPHDRLFTCAAMIGGEQAGLGSGQTKKAAEQSAAREALEWLAREGG
jgi:ribonuclease III